MQIALSDKFTYKKLIRFTVPSMAMMVFTSIYGVVDGFFVSNFVGKVPFAAVNLIMPFLMLFGTVGFMIGTGGSALLSKTLGEGNTKKANELFTFFSLVAIVLGVALSAAGIIWIEPVAVWLGAEGEMIGYCVTYGRIILVAATAFIMQNVFQSFFVVAGKPNLGLGVTVAAGVTNMVLDALLVWVFDFGVAGAAVATAISQAVGGIIPVIYFALPNSSTLRFTKPTFDLKALVKTCTNGSSELMTNLSLSAVNMIYNFQLIKLAGDTGIAAYGTVMYVGFIFISVFIGYSIGSAPLIGYNYGAGNREELKNIRKKSFVILFALAVMMFVLGELLAYPLAKLYGGYDSELLEMTTRAMELYSLSYIIIGFNIFGSAFFTALNNGLVSAILSFLRTLVFQVVAVYTLPIFLELDGIWFAPLAAEIMSLTVTVMFLLANRKKYGY